MSADRPVAVAILTVSDRCSRGEAVDRSGPALGELLGTRLGATIAGAACVPDDAEAIARQVRAWANGDAAVDLVLTTGGTGLSPRDRTPEAIRPLLDREAPGLMELARAATAATSPRSYLSRGIAGTIGRTLVLTLPGSVAGATEQCEALLGLLPHAIAILRGEGGGHAMPAAREGRHGV